LKPRFASAVLGNLHSTLVLGLAAFGLLLLMSCGAARPVKYYTLDPEAMNESVASQPFPVNLVVGRITVPYIYRDDRLVYETGPVELGTYEYHRWAEPPGYMLQSMLIQALRASGRYRSIDRVSSNARGDYVLRGRLFSLSEVDGSTMLARFSIEVELFQPKTGTTVWTHDYSHDEPVGGKTVETVIEAMEKNVRAGMAQIVASLNDYFASHLQP
jgi:ABC-type uncharacterized transport system auxiliary subunit